MRNCLQLNKKYKGERKEKKIFNYKGENNNSRRAMGGSDENELSSDVSDEEDDEVNIFL